MRIYTPSGIAMEITRRGNGVIDVTNHFPPREYNSVEEMLKGKYDVMREMLAELKREVPELRGEAGNGSSEDEIIRQSVQPQRNKQGTNYAKPVKPTSVNYGLKGGIWITSTVKRKLSEGGGNINIKVKYFADGTISKLFTQGDNSPVDTAILEPAIYASAMQYINTVKNDLDKLRNDDPKIKERLEFLANDKEYEIDIAIPIHVGTDSIHENNTLPERVASYIKYNPSNTLYGETHGTRAPRIGLAHELLGHAYNNATGVNVSESITDPSTQIEGNPKTGIPIEEEHAIYWENVERAALGEEQRVSWTDWKNGITYRIPDNFIIKK
jgi:hypothetical protein